MTNSTAAGTILNQLGGNKFVSMVGATGLLNLGNGLQCKFKGSEVANTLRVELEANDTYTVKFYKMRGLDCNLVVMVEGVHAENLCSLFEQITFLRVSLT